VCLSDFLVRTYDARTGRLVWQDRVNHGGADNFAAAITATGGRIYSAGSTETGDDIKQFAVVTYDTR
jgi:hypothetical protein